MDDNERLKDKFQQLHAVVVGQNLSAAADYLFSMKIISSENMEDLRGSCHGGGCWATDQSRRLMTLLHRSGHPRAFTELHRALDAEDSTKWIVNELDQLPVDEQLTHTNTVDPACCQCPSCGHAHQSASAAEGWSTLTTLYYPFSWMMLAYRVCSAGLSTVEAHRQSNFSGPYCLLEHQLLTIV